jgi:predicted alpha/beta-hydrolase family hydrolase
MVAAESPNRLAGLLLTSYPLHPPGKPNQLRTEHLSALRMPCLFLHGTKDPFGSVEEMRKALAAIPGPVKLLPVAGAGHDLGGGRKYADVLAGLPDQLAGLVASRA